VSKQPSGTRGSKQCLMNSSLNQSSTTFPYQTIKKTQQEKLVCVCLKIYSFITDSRRETVFGCLWYYLYYECIRALARHDAGQATIRTRTDSCFDINQSNSNDNVSSIRSLEGINDIPERGFMNARCSVTDVV
jgi:hypothetical protein